MATFGQYLPGLPWAGAFSASVFTLNQSTDQCEWIFKADAADTLTRLGLRVGSSPSGTATTWKFSLQGVDGTNGFPDGTIKGGGSPASVTFTNSGLVSGTWYWFNLANSYTCTPGEDLAMVLAYDSGTSPSAGVNDIGIAYVGGWTSAMSNPTTIANDNGSRTKQSTTPCFGYGSASTAYGWPMSLALATTVSNATNPNEVGNKFNLNFGTGSTYKIAGVRMLMQMPSAATNSFVLRLYDGTTVIQDVTIDSEITQATSTRSHVFTFDETTLATLSSGSDYRIVVAPVAGSHVVHGYTMSAAADWDAYPGHQLYASTSRNGGAWTDSAVSRYAIELKIQDVTGASSSGGLIVNPGMGGW